MALNVKSQSISSHQHELPYAIITGASEGIGAEFARQLAVRGSHSIILVARSADKLSKVKQDLAHLLASTATSRRKRVIPALIDISLDLSSAKAAEMLDEKTKGLPVTLLIANAGTAVAGIFENETLLRLRSLNALNVVGVAELAAVFLPRMKDSLDRHASVQRTYAIGGLITLSSVAGLMPVPSMAAYGAGKAYILSLSEAIHHEQLVLHSGLHVTCVLPGPTKSALWSLDGGKPSNVIVPWTTCEQVVSAALRGFDCNTAVVVPGISNQLAAFGIRLAPKFLVRRIAAVVMNQWPEGLNDKLALRKRSTQPAASSQRNSANAMIIISVCLGILLVVHGFPSLMSNPSAPYLWFYRKMGWMAEHSENFPFFMTFRNIDNRLFLHDRVEQIPRLYRTLHVIPALIWSCGMPLQHMSTTLRTKYPRFHRWNGRILFSISVLLMCTGLYFMAIGTTYSEKGLFTIHHLPNHPWLIYPTFDQDLLLVSVMQALTLFLAWRAARQGRLASHQYWASMFTITSYIIHLDRLGFTLIFLIGRALQLLPQEVQDQLPASTESKMKYEMIAFQLSATFGGLIGLVWAIRVHRSFNRHHLS